MRKEVYIIGAVMIRAVCVWVNPEADFNRIGEVLERFAGNGKKHDTGLRGKILCQAAKTAEN